MKVSKVLLPVILIVGLGLAWFSFITGSLKKHSEYMGCIEAAEDSVDKGLYEQAIEQYKRAFKYEPVEETYLRIREIYSMLYAEEHTAFIRGIYIADMVQATELFPKNPLFWITQIELYLEEQNYSKAYAAAKLAVKQSGGTELNALHKQLAYMVEVEHTLYSAFKMALNGYISVCDGERWYVINDNGESITSKYRVVGLINEGGQGLYVNNLDTRLLDLTEVSRARFNMIIEDAGYLDEASGYMPVKIDGAWTYMNTKGEYLPGQFEVAGSFYSGKAVAKRGGDWILLDVEGNQTELYGFEDIKLDLYGCHLQNNIIIAKKDGKYRLFDADFNQVGDFEADDIDICIDSQRIAYMQNNKWGFVNSTGEVVQEPKYTKAKSFANGYAAVCNEQGLWGFINKEFDLVIDYQYIDAYYFTSTETCMVSTTEGKVQMLHFMFN